MLDCKWLVTLVVTEYRLFVCCDIELQGVHVRANLVFQCCVLMLLTISMSKITEITDAKKDAKCQMESKHGRKSGQEVKLDETEKRQDESRDGMNARKEWKVKHKH